MRAGARDTNETYSPLMKALMSTATATDLGASTQRDVCSGAPLGVSMIMNGVRTCSMMKAELGGVLYIQARVYGVDTR